jgi:hypothetical protein
MTITKTIKNPLFGFVLETEDGVVSAVIEATGETGGTIQLQFDTDDLLDTAAHGFSEIANILFLAKQVGIESASEEYGLEMDTPENEVDIWAELEKGDGDSSA